MDWRHIGFDWNQVRAFLATAEAGSFSAAARASGATQPTLGRQVTALEEELGVVLFERVARGLRVTPTGLALVEHARAMAEAALLLSRVAAGQAVSLDGPVCISAGEVTASTLLPPIIAKIRAIHPGIKIEVVATNQVSNLGEREADIALRSFRPVETNLIARKVRESKAFLYATPSYLDSLGNPTTLDELRRGEFIAFDRSEAFMVGLRKLGLDLSEENFPWMSSNQQVQWALITQGSAIGVMTEEVGDADPRVVRVLPEQIAFPLQMWLTCHREVRTSQRVRVVFDLLAEALSRGPSDDE
ncbi:MAG: LysR family transcriptional regulator [Myxococcales bacterium]|nr:LysR family transcriptional regulator [Myxococcales bacterium]